MPKIRRAAFFATLAITTNLGQGETGGIEQHLDWRTVLRSAIGQQHLLQITIAQRGEKDGHRLQPTLGQGIAQGVDRSRIPRQIMGTVKQNANAGKRTIGIGGYRRDVAYTLSINPFITFITPLTSITFPPRVKANRRNCCGGCDRKRLLQTQVGR